MAPVENIEPRAQLKDDGTEESRSIAKTITTAAFSETAENIATQENDWDKEDKLCSQNVSIDHQVYQDGSEKTKKDTESVASCKGDTTDDKVPDGGYGWCVVCGCFLIQVMSYGIISSWGECKSIMQDYYQQRIFGENYPNVTLRLSFVGTLCLVCSNGMGPFAQIMGSYVGTRGVMLMGTLLLALGLILASFSTQIWHLYLTFGLCFGLGVSTLYVSSMGVAPQYFSRKRGLAMGIITSGSGIGGLVLPFVINPINQKLGAGWTCRILAFLSLAADLLGCVLVKDRRGCKVRGRKRLSDIIQLRVLKDFPYCLWCIGACLQVMGYFLPYFYLPSYCTWIGLSASQGSSLVAVASALNFVGRISSGIIADRIGPLNTNMIFATCSGLACLLIWTFSYSFGALMGYAVVFGLFCGSYSALVSPITAFILGKERFPTGFSVVILFNCLAVFSPMIASAVEGAAHPAEPFLTYKIYSGIAFILGVAFLVPVKLRMNRKFFVKT